jgi:PAS domain S-box-containing protein
MDGKYSKQWFLTISILFLVGMALAYDLYREHRRTESLEYDRLLIQARVINESLNQQLASTYRSMQRILNDLPHWRAGNSYKPAANIMLKALDEAIPGVRTFVIIDARGIARASNRAELIGRDLSKREYFTTVRHYHDPDALYLSPPYTTALNVYAMNLSRMIPGPAGEFNGIIVATLDPDYFKTLLASVQYAPDMWVAIAHGDGLQFLMVPDREGQSGKNLAQPGSFFTRHRESGRTETIMTGTAYATGEERVMAIRTIRPPGARLDKPLVVAVGREIHAVFADWRSNAMIYGSLFSGIGLVTVVFLRLNQRGVRRTDELAKRAKEELEESEKKYRLLIESLQEGIWLIDKDGNTTFVNQSMAQMLGSTVEEMLGRHLFSFMDERGKTIAMQQLVSRKQGVKEQHDFEFLHKDGRRIYTTLATSPILDEAGNYAGALAGVMNITERRRAEAKLRENEARLKTVTENAPDTILQVDRQGVISFINRCVAGITRESVIGSRIYDWVPAEQHAVLTRTLEAALDTGQHQEYESTGPGPHGDVRSYHVRVIPVTMDGQADSAIHVAEDVTERKRKEEELQRTSDLLRTFMNAIGESAFLMDRTGRILAANETVAKRFGKTVPELVGSTAEDILPPDVSLSRKVPVDAVVRTKKPVRFEDDRTGRTIDNLLYPVLNAQGDVDAVAVVGYDITERKLAEEALKQSEKKLRDITSSLAEGLYVLNDKGEVTFMNPEAEFLLGWTEAELTGKNVHDMVHNHTSNGAVLSLAECPMHSVIMTGERYVSRDQVFIRKDGTTFPVSVHSSPLLENGKVVASVTAFRDITERKRIELEREKLISELQKALAEIKTLQGILPICSSCKKIRDDKGAWHQMEAYIHEHTNVEFSHGLCKECAQKIYPKYYKEDEPDADR